MNLLRLLPVSLALLSPYAHAGMGETYLAEKGATLRAQPSATAAAGPALAENQAVIELERKNGWLRVSVKSSQAQGWLPATRVHAAKSVAKPAAQLVAEPAKPQDGRGRMVTLREIGHDKGVIFDGAHLKHQTVLHFPVLDDLKAKGMNLRLRYRASTLHERLSSLRVDIAGIPRITHKIENDGNEHELVVPIDLALIKGNSLRVDLLASLLIHEDRCVDERIGHAFLHISPDSGLEARYDAAIGSVRDAWSALPEQVTVSLPAGRLEPKVFSAAWSLVDMLYREAHKVRFVRLPEIGDVVVAPAADINKALAPQIQSGRSRPLSGASNLSLVQGPERTFLAVSDPFDAVPLTLLTARWRPLAAGQDYRVLPVTYPKLAMSGGSLELPLSSLGLDTGVRELGRTASWWSFLAGPQSLPPGARLDSLRLEVLAPPRKESDAPFELYAYLNGTLLKAVRLDAAGGKQTVNVSLPADQLQLFNRLAVSMQVKDLHGDCHGLPQGYPVQILPGSYALLKQDDSLPQRFADLPRYLAAQADIYLPEASQAQPENTLNLLARLSSVYPVQFDYERVRFVAKDAALNPTGRFIAVGDLKLAGSEMPVRFDQGRVAVVDAQGAPLLAAKELPGMTVAQIVRTSGGAGLWVRPDLKGEAAELGEFFLSEDDVAFVDSSGVRLTLNSRHPTLAQVRYLDVTSWLEFMDQHRFWFFALGWLALTALAIYLYRKSTQHREAAERS